jgi:hypothetical protein
VIEEWTNESVETSSQSGESPSPPSLNLDEEEEVVYDMDLSKQSLHGMENHRYHDEDKSEMIEQCSPIIATSNEDLLMDSSVNDLILERMARYTTDQPPLQSDHVNAIVEEDTESIEGVDDLEEVVDDMINANKSVRQYLADQISPESIEVSQDDVSS